MTKSKLLYTLILLLPLTVFAAEQSDEGTDTDEYGEITTMATQYDNVLCAATFNDQVKMSIQYIDYSISKGQVMEYITDAPVGGKNDGCIIVRAGRHKTKDVVNAAKNFAGNVKWDKYNMGVTDHSNTTGMHDKTPGSLNFAVKANLTFRFNQGIYVCPNVIIAQGSTPTMNNWWVISNMNNDSNKPYVEIYCDKGSVYFYKFGYDLSPVLRNLKKDRMQVSTHIL
jgi:hypothetical protein